MNNKIFIYNDDGCCDISILRESLEQYFCHDGICVETINSDEITNSELDSSVLALFMPGGVAEKYYVKLHGKGNDNIRTYVANGGMYFGICAGAYYACKSMEFEKNVPGAFIKRQYNLNLIDACAKGTLYRELSIKPFSNSFDSVCIVDLKSKSGKINYSALYHGGPFFDVFDKKCDVIANYNIGDLILPAIISKKFGKGQVVLSGVHFESGVNELENLFPFFNDDFAYHKIFTTLKSKENTRKKLFNHIVEKIR